MVKYDSGDDNTGSLGRVPFVDRKNFPLLDDIVGQKLVFDSTGNLLTKENPDRVCAFLMPNLTVLINAFFENLMNGRNPNEVMFNTTGCFDTGPSCGGWGRVIVRMSAELNP